MNPVIFLVLIAILLSGLHMIAPDHWMPLSALNLKNSFGSKKLRVTAFLLGLLHGITSTALALLVIFVGVYIFGTREIRIISVIILFIVAAYILINSYREAQSKRSVENTSLAVSVFPDPAFLPILVAAAAYGIFSVSIVSILFVISSALFLLLIVILVNMGLAKSLSKLRPVTVDRIVVIALLLTSVYIYLYG